MAKLRRGVLPLQPTFIVGPSIGLSSPSRRWHLEEGVLGFHLALKLLQDVNQARTQLECELVQETQGWLKNMTTVQSNWPGDMRDGEHGWFEQADATFQEVFSQVSLPSCCLSVFPLQFPSAT